MPIKPNKGTQGYMLWNAMRHGTITNIEAMERFHITSFHRRISDLKELGWTIAKSWDENPNTGTRYKVYRLVDDGKDVA